MANHFTLKKHINTSTNQTPVFADISRKRQKKVKVVIFITYKLPLVDNLQYLY